MKTLKFRIWDKQFNKFLYQLPEKQHLAWERFDIQQWTGLLDNGGKGIYEGDILKSAGIVTWNDVEVRWSCIDIEWNDRKEWHDMLWNTTPLEIIGNTIENKDLIK